MGFLSVLSNYEFLMLGIILLMVMGIAGACIFNKNKLAVFSPILFIAIIYLVYTVVGPIIFLNNEINVFPEAYIRPFYSSAWLGSLISLGCISLAYYFPVLMARPRPEKVPNNQNKAFLIGFSICALGLCMYAAVNPGKFLAQLNPLNVGKVEEDMEIGGFVNYIANGISFVISGLAIMLISLPKHLFATQRFIFGVLLLISAALFVSIGFRYRILMLFVTLFFAYFLHKGARPSLTLIITSALVLVMSIGIIGETRTYGSGIKLEGIAKKQSRDILIDGFKDANIFPISGAVINAVPGRVPFVGLQLLKNVLIFPIPRSILPGKNTDAYIRNPIKTYRPLRQIEAHKWAAMMYYAEWYIAFGWAGLVFISLVIGFLYRYLWEWVLVNLGNPSIIALYAISCSFLYIFISRGYLPNIVMSFFYIIGPALAGRFFYRLKLR